MLDKKIHDVFKGLMKVKWNSFEKIGYNAPYFEYYYAEDMLYVIKDTMLGNYWFVEARSPIKAMQECEKLMNEAHDAYELKGNPELYYIDE